MKKILLRYKVFLLFLSVNLILLFVTPNTGRLAFEITKDNLLQMLLIIPPIFILLGLLDVWVGRETMIKYMGDKSGIKGGVIAFIIGSAAAGPLYAAFPVAWIFLKKGVKLTNIFIFIGAWATTKLPILLFEASNMGLNYMLLRLFCNIIGVIVIAVTLEATMSEKEKDAMYKRARAL